MDLADVEMFLSIVSTKSISKTAEALFLSQPTVSHRLKLLEKELNCSLVLRSKGFKQIELTPEGMDFIPIAERMMALWKETRLLQGRRERTLLTIGCTDSMNVALLAPFYRQLIHSGAALDLNVPHPPVSGAVQPSGRPRHRPGLRVLSALLQKYPL